MPKLSVVMSVYNSEQFLEACIDSILNQTFTDFEFIIVNSASTDRSSEILKKFQQVDARIRVIDTQKCTIATAMNLGIQASLGQYVARMDSDDISLPHRFQKQIEYLDHHPHIGIVSTKVEIIGDAEPSRVQLYEYKLNIDIDDNNAEEILLTHWYCFCTPATMIRAEIFNLCGMYGDAICEDFQLLMNAISKGIKLYKLNECLLQFRLHKNSSTVLENMNGEGIKDSIVVKLKHVPKTENIASYVVWGTGIGGQLAFTVLKDKRPSAICRGFIDVFKDGEWNGLDIYEPEKILQLDVDYIFIATEPGKKNAISFLTSLKLRNIENFLCVV